MIVEIRDWQAYKNERGEPYLPITVMEPLIWRAALKHWTAGSYRNAVGDVATAVSQFTQRRLGRCDISEKDLMAQAFTSKPPEADKPRPDAPATRTTRRFSLSNKGPCTSPWAATRPFAIRRTTRPVTGIQP